mgnify:FL=1
MTIVLDALTAHDVEQVRQWRNQTPEALRTPFRLTAEMQQEFYRDVVCNRAARHRYWAVVDPAREHIGVRPADRRAHQLVGMVGLTDWEPENSLAQISLVINPAYAGHGYGRAAVEAVLGEAFERMGLRTVYGECYHCNERGLAFWRRMALDYDAEATMLPRRKFWAGQLWPSFYFSFAAESFLARKKEAV